MQEIKSFGISKNVVMMAFERVKANKGRYGIDEQSIERYEMHLKPQLVLILLWRSYASITAQTMDVRQSIHPIVLFKIMFIGYFYGIRS